MMALVSSCARQVNRRIGFTVSEDRAFFWLAEMFRYSILFLFKSLKRDSEEQK